MLTHHVQRDDHLFNRDVGIYESSLALRILLYQQTMKDSMKHISHREAYLSPRSLPSQRVA